MESLFYPIFALFINLNSAHYFINVQIIVAQLTPYTLLLKIILP